MSKRKIEGLVQRNTDMTGAQDLLVECKTNFSQFLSQASRNTDRIKKRFPHLNPDKLFFLCFGRVGGFTAREQLENVLITDEPQEIFGSEPVFHVTSSAALKDLALGKEILPPMFHLHEKTRTHRGIGLELWSRLCDALEIDVGKKDMFIWTGRKIDPEQLVIEDNMAKTGNDLDSAIIALLFEEKGKKRGSEPLFEIKEALCEVLEVLSRGEKPEDVPELKEFIDEFCRQAFFVFGIRDGWFVKLKDRLFGRVKLKTAKYIQDFIGLSLPTALDFFAQKHSGKEEAVILKINPQQIFAKHDLFAFPMTKRQRHPDMIVPLPSVSRDDIVEVYVADPVNFDASLVPANTQLKSFLELPEEVWLGGKYVADLTIEKIDPENPLCQLNYPEPAGKIYKRHFDQRRITFAGTKNYRREMSNPAEEVNLLVDSFGEEIFSPIPITTEANKMIIFSQCLAGKTIEGIFR
jgi:hypothetical protein